MAARFHLLLNSTKNLLKLFLFKGLPEEEIGYFSYLLGNAHQALMHLLIIAAFEAQADLIGHLLFDQLLKMNQQRNQFLDEQDAGIFWNISLIGHK